MSSGGGATGLRSGQPAPLGSYAAAALVFGASASVLVVEIVALRMLAPYLGLSLETSTLVIGLALAAIAIGSWFGGRMADLLSPRRALGPLLGISGVAVAATPFLIRGTAAVAGNMLVFAVASLTVIVPGTLLAAVTPMVIKLQLTRLTETGSVVGRLSGIGTVGAIVGTVVTGFVLISRVPVSGILLGLGAALVLAALAVELRVRGWRSAAVPAALVAVAGVGLAVVPATCDAETVYHCAVVRTDPERATGRVLLLDSLPHSYVDLDDPTHLEFAYARAVASVVDIAYAPGRPLRAYHLGGGGLTVPRYLEQVRPGSTNLVSEIDPGVVEIDRDRLGLQTSRDLEVRVEGGRLGLRRLPDASRDLVVGDAFGGVSVPWHLTTRQAVADIRRVLTAKGVYVVNLIDNGSLAFARAELATLGAVFAHVALVAEPDTLSGTGGGNLVAIAANRPLDLARLSTRLTERSTGWGVSAGPDLAAWVGDAPVLTDDYAPVDQLLTPYRTR